MKRRKKTSLQLNVKERDRLEGRGLIRVVDLVVMVMYMLGLETVLFVCVQPEGKTPSWEPSEDGRVYVHGL